MTRILLVDDHALVRAGVRRLLEDADDMEIVAEATTGEQAIKLSRSLDFDLIMMDINMPGFGGLEASRKLLKLNPCMKIIILSMHMDGPLPGQLLDMGVKGYLTKGSSRDEMLLALREVYAGRRYICAETAQQMVLNGHGNDESPFSDLSPRELNIVILCAKGMRIQEIGEHLCISPKTVSSYRTRIYEKLGVENDVELSRLAILHQLVEL